MSDPAVEAADRVLALHPLASRSVSVKVAREALAPIQAELAPLSEYADGYLPGESGYADGVKIVLKVLAPLIYPSEEL